MESPPSCCQVARGVHQRFLRAVEVLEAGGIVACATETLYGLSVDPLQPAAVERLLQLKGRGGGRGLILLVPAAADVHRLADPSPRALRLMARFWPGPLTLVLPARPGLSAAVTVRDGSHDWVALRHSPAPAVTNLLRAWGGALVSTSANVSGQPPLADAAAIQRSFGAAVPVILPGAVDPAARPSSVVRVEGPQVTLLRDGALDWKQIVDTP
ncbi:MAG: L-threonylcarbamoyladenylate synthase [Magnetococcus sp. WYHC-3]